MFLRKLLDAPIALTFNDVILLPGYTDVEPREIDLSTRFSANIPLHIPLASSPMDTVSEHEVAVEMALMGGIGVIHRNMSVEKQVEEAVMVKEASVEAGINPLLDDEGRLRVAAAISPFDEERALKLERHVDALVSDVAHFHNARVLSAARRLASKIGVDFIAGNIGTYEAALDVVSKVEGVAGLRVGISSGSICSTGEVTGVAAPTLYAVASVADALRELGADIPIIADGGIRAPGDGAKALGAGASSLMLGYALAGTNEAVGSTIIVGGKCYKEYRGMASPSSRTLRYARDRYAEKPAKDIAEGIEGLVPCRGPLREIVKSFIAGLQAAMGYVGARSVKETWKKARFARLTLQGRMEISPHSVLRGADILAEHGKPSIRS